MNRSTENRRFSNFQIGLIAIVLTFIGFYLAFTKSIPFAGHGYQLKAIVQDAENIRAKSPVRISGVDVGEVSDVQHLTGANGDGQDAAVVTMDLKDTALPVRQDATLQLRPRLFLEGNLFVDLHPGSPSAPSSTADRSSRRTRPRARSRSTRCSPRCRPPSGRTSR